MVFCTNCGANVPDDVKICTECGNLVNEVSPVVSASSNDVPDASIVEGSPVSNGEVPVIPVAPVMPVEPVVPVAPTIAPAPSQPAQQPAQPWSAPSASPMEAAPPADSPYAVMGTWSFVLWTILFSLPMVGFIVCLITAFTSTKINQRNYARSHLILLAIYTVLTILLVVAFIVWVVAAVENGEFDRLMQDNPYYNY